MSAQDSPPCEVCGDADDHAELVEDVRRMIAWALVVGLVFGVAVGVVIGWAARGPQ